MTLSHIARLARLATDDQIRRAGRLVGAHDGIQVYDLDIDRLLSIVADEMDFDRDEERNDDA